MNPLGRSTQHEWMTAHLVNIEQQFAQLEPRGSPFWPVIQYLVSVPGKRLRSRLVLACSRLPPECPEPEEELIGGALGIELLHEASLVHDDICDHSESRRGLPSVVAKFGLRTATTTGALLMAHGISLLGKATRNRQNVLPFEMVRDIAEGQLLELLPQSMQSDLSDLAAVRHRYQEIVRGKTSMLFELACLLGARLGGASEPCCSAVQQWAQDLAMAYQILDDVRDVEGPPTLGKAAGSDLARGIVTWPVIELLTVGSLSLNKMADAPFDPKQPESIHEALFRSGSLDRARSHARDLLSRAHGRLVNQPATPGREFLLALTAEVAQL